jgi:hypothetical protein
MYISKPHLNVSDHKDDSRISPSSLRSFSDCPYYYWAKRVAKFWADESKDYFDLGSGADSLITQGPEDYQKNFRVVARRTEALKLEADKDNVTLLSPKQDEIIKGMQKELFRQPLFAKFNSEGWQKQAWLETDLVDEFDDSKIHAVSKLDYYHKQARVIADLKTTANLSTFHPATYAMQMGFYHEMAKLVDGIDCQVFIIAVDKTDMTRSRIYLMSEHTINQGKTKMRMAIEQLKACRETNAWLIQEINDDRPHECPTYDTCPYGIQRRLFII